MSKKRTVKQIAATKRMREALAAKRAGKKRVRGMADK